MIGRVLRYLFLDRRTGRIVVGQWPNLPLWLFGAALLVELAAEPGSRLAVAARVAATVLLAVWAGDELLRGVNPWRRILGAAVLLVVALRLLA